MAEETKGKRKGVENLKPELRKQFTSEYQPSPEAKKAGWQEVRAQKLLTQMILKKMAEGTNLNEYVDSLLTNAKEGNAKAIDTINNGIEEQKIVTENKHTIDVETVTFK